MPYGESFDEVPPEPSALIESLRSVGYSLPTAMADIIDNSIAAEAKNIQVEFHWAGENSSVVIFDDGIGMTEDRLRLAMRPGSRNPLEKRSAKDLGRFGLGLKTASLSHCRKLCVVSKTISSGAHCRTWDLDVLAKSSTWRLLVDPTKAAREPLKRLAKAKNGTAVIWSCLDRLIGGDQTGDAVAHSRFNDAIDEVRDHLALTFHRYIESKEIRVSLNGKMILPWNPFILAKTTLSSATPEEFIPFGKSGITFQGFVLPHKDTLGDKEFLVGAGPRGWAAQQGFYVYRNKRLLVYGDWLRLGRPSPWTREEHYR
ncbi:MAG: ATP-binding protein, partial [Ktedonobacteraceae bacterium]